MTQLFFTPTTDQKGKEHPTIVTTGGHLYISSSFLCFNSAIASDQVEQTTQDTEYVTVRIPNLEILIAW